MSFHITYKVKDLTDIIKCKINVTVRNSQKTKCKLNGLVNTKMKQEETVKLTKVLYAPQTVNNCLIFPMLVSKGAMMGDTQEKMTIKKNVVNMILDTRKGKILA